MKKIYWSFFLMFIFSCSSDDDSDCNCKEYATNVGKYSFNECRVQGFVDGWENILSVEQATLMEREHHCD